MINDIISSWQQYSSSDDSKIAWVNNSKDMLIKDKQIDSIQKSLDPSNTKYSEGNINVRSSLNIKSENILPTKRLNVCPSLINHRAMRRWNVLIAVLRAFVFFKALISKRKYLQGNRNFSDYNILNALTGKYRWDNFRNSTKSLENKSMRVELAAFLQDSMARMNTWAVIRKASGLELFYIF